MLLDTKNDEICKISSDFIKVYEGCARVPEGGYENVWKCNQAAVDNFSHQVWLNSSKGGQNS